LALADEPSIALSGNVPGPVSIDAIHELHGIATNAPVWLLLIHPTVIVVLVRRCSGIPLSVVLFLPVLIGLDLFLTVLSKLFLLGLVLLLPFLSHLFPLFLSGGSPLSSHFSFFLKRNYTFLVSFFTASHVQVGSLVGLLCNGNYLASGLHAIFLADFSHLLQGLLTLLNIRSQLLLLLLL